jgi:8-oxo-dGTP pyrophosphatase MutT (NUDIX family)
MEPEQLKQKISSLTENEILTKLRSIRPHKIAEKGLKPSAVLVPLISRAGGWCVLFTQRSHQVENHKGEISFPGGMIEPGETPLGAALRETREEVGIPEDKIHLLGELDEIPTISGFSIYPFVARIDWPVQLRPNPVEIETVFILPLGDFVEEGRLKTEHWKRDGQDYPVYFYQFKECMVWGATAKITKNLIERLKA